MRSAKNTIFFIDEPDSHLSAVSRAAITDFFAWSAAKNKHWILFSSHSVEPIQKLVDTEMIVLERPEYQQDQNLDLSRNKRNTMLRLGFSLSRKYLFLVEDIDSLEVLSKVISKWLPDIAPSIDIRKVLGGAEAVDHLLKYFPEDTPVCNLTIVLDGDKRDGTERRRRLFLPGSHDPIAQVKAWATQHVAEAAIAIDVPEDALSRSLAALAGVNHHDFCSSLAHKLAMPNLDTIQVRKLLVSAWLRQPDQELAFKELVTAIETIFQESLLSI